MLKPRSKSVAKWLVLAACALTFTASVIAVCIGVGLDIPVLIGFATTALPASLAASAAIVGVQTWADARIAALDEKSRDALARFIEVSTTVVTDGIDLARVELPLRANIATWASHALIRKLGERTELLNTIGSEIKDDVDAARARAGDPNASVTVDIGDRLVQLARVTAEAVALARQDIGLSAVEPKVIYEVLYGTVNGRKFNDSDESLPIRSQ